MALASAAPRLQRNNFDDLKSLLPLKKMEQTIDLWAREYRENRPYPHIGIDNFFDKAVIETLISEYPDPSYPSWNRASFDPQFEEAKLSLDRIEEFPPNIRNFVEALNSPIFLTFLEHLVGIDGLIPDPYLVGGGLHMTPRGGRLGIHADFNLHKKLGLDRRLNLLLYLNENWQAAWGGEFELWDKDVKTKVKSYLPTVNRMVVFSTTDVSFHGHPDPLTCPKGHYRKSIALYYYTNGRPPAERSDAHSTLFKARPGEHKGESVFRAFVRQLTPPIIWELARRMR